MDTYISSRQGFTIVELLIVIVVVAVLAAVSVSAFSGTQQRARDAQRTQDMQAIVKALELYKIHTGSYPTTSTGSNTTTGWEVSSKSPNLFLSALKTSGVLSSAVPVDPTNTVDGFEYRYYRYLAGSNGCPASRGAYYVLMAKKVETTATQLSTSPGFKCGTPTVRDWSTEGGWVTGAFTNG